MATQGIVATTRDNHGKLTMMKRLVNSGNGSSCTCRQSMANYCTQVCNLKTLGMRKRWRWRANEEQYVSWSSILIKRLNDMQKKWPKVHAHTNEERKNQLENSFVTFHSLVCNVDDVPYYIFFLQSLTLSPSADSK